MLGGLCFFLWLMTDTYTASVQSPPTATPSPTLADLAAYLPTNVDIDRINWTGSLTYGPPDATVGGDAGTEFMQAGATITITWPDGPRDAQYIVFLTEGDPVTDKTVIGVDYNPADGISLTWTIPPDMYGTLLAVAVKGNNVTIAYGGNLGSGDLPPAGQCVVSASSDNALAIYRQPGSLADENQFGELQPGYYADVLAARPDGWIEIDTSTAHIVVDNPPPTGWISPIQYFHFNGPCRLVLGGF